MKREPAMWWAEALESGQHEQGQGGLTLLAEPDKGLVERDCCLGVLCKVAIAHGLIMPVIEKGKKRRYDGCAAYLPEPVREWAGLSFDDPVCDALPGLKEGNNLFSFANDVHMIGFPELAKVIRENWENIR